MNLIPAKVAGVKNIVVATPCAKDGSIHPCLLRACEIAGATIIYRAGGAQGIAAMAYGTATCPPEADDEWIFLRRLGFVRAGGGAVVFHQANAAKRMNGPILKLGNHSPWPILLGWL